MATDKLVNAKEIHKLIKSEDKSFDINYSDFKDIITIFNNSMVDEVLKGYQFIPFSKLGQLEIKKIDRSTYNNINWKASNELKAQLIEEGKVPYNKETAPNGVFWHVYYTDPHYFRWNWFRNKKARFTKNIMSYKFKPTDQNKKRCSKEIDNNVLAELEYDVYNKNSK